MPRSADFDDMEADGITFTPTSTGAFGGNGGAPTFAFSSMAYDRQSNASESSGYNVSGRVSTASSTGERATMVGIAPRPTFTALATKTSGLEKTSDYKGRIRRWPGLLFLFLLLCGASFAITYFATNKHSDLGVRTAAYAQRHADKSAISQGSGSDSQTGGTTSTKDIISDDGVVGNPKKYPASTCELPDYQSKNGQIVAISKNGTEVPIGIKGINWFGMETGQAIPFGLWDNSQNGTTAYQVAKFLSNNKFNAVRLPLMIDWINTNKVPQEGLINLAENRAINITDYMSLLKSIVKTLQFRNIGVLISLHTLTFQDNGALWYNDQLSEDDFLGAVDILTKNLCTSEYWNIMGLDLKNEPYKGTWGDGTATDFRAGAKRIADRMLDGCSSWMGFVEGVYGTSHTITVDGAEVSYSDWYGGALQGAKTKGLDFGTDNKVVWAPHYYTPAVYPQSYFYDSGFVELDDATLKARVEATMEDMFGFLTSDTGYAVVLGEFGGLYAKDAHPMKTIQRCTDYTIEVMKAEGYAGGFVWSLNPESAYGYNPGDTQGVNTEGILMDDWLQANDVFLGGMAALDDIANLQPFPCFDTTGSASSSSSSS